MSFRPVLAGALALIAAPALACQPLTRHFGICAEDTPWENGIWESAGDSDTLRLGDFAYEGFEDYLGHNPEQSIETERETLISEWQDTLVAIHALDSFDTPDLHLVRLIASRAWPDEPGFIEATMIAGAKERPGLRLMLRVTAPADTTPAELDTLSRSYAGLIRPAAPQEGN
ncbi:hypothetical protein [Pseudogemmobacter humi]|uniref:Uncharacterized protein n=1 Tax=Pseudogemmobacter humi TaxID=2483812 RepID=A0A3P5XQJ9_9RHOB|nr:hypothetical protein [Pseudogemmobacter humi]VDC30189.1 hypothetical protein XINFAN_02470 [Pseudogemmobacter humi]